MKKNKLMIIVGTRPEIIRLSEVIKISKLYFDVILVHTGQNYDYTLNEVFFEEFELDQPQYFLNAPGKNLGETVGNIIQKSYEVLEKEKPDALLILGDTNSCLSAYSAKRLKIPIFHMEAGNRCFDFNVPEEINRKVVDHVSDVNLAYTENARRYLINEGIKNDFLYVTGSPMPEVIHKNIEKINNSDILKKLGLSKGKYFVISMHREENVDNQANFLELVESLNNIAKTYNKPIIFSTHPRTKKIIEKNKIVFHNLIKTMEPLGFFDYVKLQKDSFCVLSDSGTISEESAILNFPAVSIRTSGERPEALDAGSVVIGGITSSDMFNSIEIVTGLFDEDKKPMVKDYTDINVSEKVVKIMQSYIGIVNKRTWQK